MARRYARRVVDLRRRPLSARLCCASCLALMSVSACRSASRSTAIGPDSGSTSGVASSREVPPWAAEGPAARQFADWLAAFNSGDRGVLLAYHQQHFPYEAASHDVSNIDREVGLSKGTGGFEVRKSEGRSATEFGAVLKERRSEQFARATMEVAASEPHPVVRFQINPIPTPEEFLTPDDRRDGAGVLDDGMRRSLIDSIANEIRSNYVLSDVGQKMSTSIDAHLAHGDYDKITRGDVFAETVTEDLRRVSHDLHLHVDYGPRHPPPPSQPLADRIAEARGANFGFGAIERLQGNVAHLVIDALLPVDAVRDAVAGFMSQVADADALIVDLRDNHGGDPETVRLVASYLFDAAPVHLNDLVRRDGSKQEFWTLANVPGARFGGRKPVYVLTSKQTFSGGEEFAYDLQSLHRAAIVGEITGGGANPTTFHQINDWFAVVVPDARAVNPVTKTNWEGVGVAPDVRITAEAALDDAHRRAVNDISKMKAEAR
jgi:hypothetical protein